MRKAAGKKSYDYKADVLYVSLFDRSFDHSEHFEQFILDYDANGEIVGLEILDVSVLFKCPKQALVDLDELVLEVEILEDAMRIDATLKSYVRNRRRDTVFTLERVRPEHLHPSKGLALCVS
ncbi:MAG: DUF2283 domain-containing protein [Candidatus Woesearchaeota archaeon]